MDRAAPKQLTEMMVMCVCVCVHQCVFIGKGMPKVTSCSISAESCGEIKIATADKTEYNKRKNSQL